MSQSAALVNSTRTYMRSTAAVCRKIAEETLVVPIRGKVGDLNCIFSLNSLASELWNQMDQEFSAQELIDWVLAGYDVTPEVAAADVTAFLNDLASVGLITATSSEQPVAAERDPDNRAPAIREMTVGR
jgi:capsid portal protein